ncbi:MAG: LLM class flavin-dependent oxidoreductase [Chlorobiales bacterium]|nr:LLM class flavin-dependent oxidoreductase [Chlorobiales bacterium]
MAQKWKWGILFSGDNLTLSESVRYARMAEDAGADSVWTTELGRDSFVPLAAMAAECKRVRLGTGVAVFARPPALTEITAMSMAELTGERFVLGLGTAPKMWNENWHGLPYRKPVTRMREYVEAIRLMWSASPTNPIEYKGEMITITDYRRIMAPPCAPPPIHLAAVQPAMLQMTGELADGLLANLLNTPHYFTDIVHPNIKKGLSKAGRSMSDIEMCSLKVCSVDKDRARARRRARAPIAFYSNLPYFDQVLDPAGFTKEKMAIRDAAARNDVDAMLDLVTEDMIDALVLAGTPDEVRKQLDRFEGLFETVLLYCPMPFIDREESVANHDAMIEAFAD